ncbi:DUF1161 domain-containing protein [Uliginosibacterium gangwonense]|uniref:DUF1161 domain-containing protein n=1 Tax=Uliginosibacterium gangwonense TaxID=392736 RepID=UPI00036CB3BE|nr:DUF1161 domain-containing protein [Uliginosibacterium gangwonense]
MRTLLIALSIMVVAGPVYAAKSCDELKTGIEAKIQGHGVKSFTLEIIDANQVKDQKVVGSCEGGSKKIVYKKGA